jgi:hypothetical protein
MSFPEEASRKGVRPQFSAQVLRVVPLTAQTGALSADLTNQVRAALHRVDQLFGDSSFSRNKTFTDETVEEPAAARPGQDTAASSVERGACQELSGPYASQQLVIPPQAGRTENSSAAARTAPQVLTTEQEEDAARRAWRARELARWHRDQAERAAFRLQTSNPSGKRR